MVFRDLLSDTIRTLWTHKLRTFLTMFGIAWGIISITLMVAAGEGLRVGQVKQQENFGKDIMIVFAGRTSLQAGGLRAGRRVWWEDTDVVPVKRESPDCEYVLPELGNNAPVRSSYNNATLLITGSWPPFADLRTIHVGEGRFYSWEDDAQSRHVAFLGSDAKKQLFGTRDALGAKIWINDVPYIVIGVMREKSQNSSYDGQDVQKIFIPFSIMLQEIPNKPPQPPRSIDRMLVAPKSWETHEACKLQVRRALGRLHNFDPRDKEAAGIWDTVEDAKAFRMIIDGMEYFLGAIGATSLFLGGIGVMNVMLVAVRERTREIGVRKAVGATRRAIVGQFFVESLIVVFLSGGVGLGIGYGICGLINLIPMPDFFAGMLVSWQTGLLSFLLLGTVAVLSALYPARRAAAVDPIEALRYEPGS
ncbi:MAG TPA: ABC transporter permease [Candidatus Acidoferrales bacterium]|jgi:putative ABC transport system permease protein|nr:ABC transporter permease [Candidatus Acidoferrales bacterium]